LSVEPAATLLSRSRDWLREHRDGGQLADNFRLVSTFFPHVPHPNSVHVLVVTEERMSIFVDNIVTCLTCALVLEDLDYLGGLEGQALRRTPVLCISTSALLLIWPVRTPKVHQIITELDTHPVKRCLYFRRREASLRQSQR
jgi:hypothetical protein